MKDTVESHRMVTQIGLDFIRADGKRFTCCQLLEDGVAIGTADFLNGKLTAYGVLPSVHKENFFNKCQELIESVPVKMSKGDARVCFPHPKKYTP